jgi:hypothetical protein
MKQYLLSRLKEPSTWRGAAFILAACGVPSVDPNLVMQVGLGIAGIIGMATADKK